MKSAFAYFGGKMGMADRIVSLMPEHRVYMEPFFGSGAVLFAKPLARFEIVNDIDDLLVNFWRVLRERPEDLAAVCALTPHARTEFVAALEPTDDELERARRFWVRVNQSFAKTASATTGWTITTARSQATTSSILSRIGRFADVAGRLSNVSIENCDAADLIQRLATDDTLIYCDPPYLGSTRVQRSDTPADYRHDMGAVDAHERLAEVLSDTRARVILSGYPSQLYDRLYDGWNVIDFAVTSFSSNAATAERGSRTERLWLNFTPEAADNTLDLFGAAS